MIFYFSGTGNSLYVAKDIANKQGEQIISISKEIKSNKDVYEYELGDNEKIIFVYPIYAWAPPRVVLDFIDKIRLKNYKNNYVTSIATCGKNVGDAMNLLSKKLNSIGINLNSGFSIVMPNNYMIMGDVEPKDNISTKIKKAIEELDCINNIITSHQNDIFKIEKGPLPGIMTTVINPFFNKYAIDTSKFTVDNKCTSCKICEKVCNTKTIKVDNKPTWGKQCTGCLACINYCPEKAIQFGKNTLKKGRYTNPYISIDEMTV